MIHVVTDSTADLTDADAAALGVRVVPLTVFFGEEEFKDGVDISADEFYRRLVDPKDKQPRTSQPPPEDFVTLYRELLTDPADEVISIHISSGLSGTLQSANVAAAQFEGRVKTFDSKMVSAGIQNYVRIAAAMVIKGADSATIMKALDDRVSRSHLWILFDTVTYLHKGGRIGGAQAFVGGILGVKPLLQIRDSQVNPHSRVRSRDKGFKALLELASNAGKLEMLEVMYSTEPAVAEGLAKQLQGRYPDLAVRFGQIGPVVGVYAGPGCIGIAVVEAT